MKGKFGNYYDLLGSLPFLGKSRGDIVNFGNSVVVERNGNKAI